MKTTIVPAQVTTVEDRIIGSLSPSQVLLLIAPLFISAALFGVLPPFMEFNIPKTLLIGALIGICAVLAVKIKGKLIVTWLIVWLRYALRPRIYILNKNCSVGREDNTPNDEVMVEEVTYEVPLAAPTTLEPVVVLSALQTVNNPDHAVTFKATKNGGLYVHLTKIKE